MARQPVILVLVLFSILAVVLAEPPKASPDGKASSTPAAESPDSIGPVDDPTGAEGGDDVVEGPVGGPTPLGEYATAPTGSSGAATLEIFAGLGGAAAAALAGLVF